MNVTLEVNNITDALVKVWNMHQVQKNNNLMYCSMEQRTRNFNISDS